MARKTPHAMVTSVQSPLSKGNGQTPAPILPTEMLTKIMYTYRLSDGKHYTPSKDNIRALKRFSLVHSSWRTVAQSMLFVSLALGRPKRTGWSNEGRLTPEHALKFLDSSPHIALFVQHLSIVGQVLREDLTAQVISRLPAVANLYLTGEDKSVSGSTFWSIAPAVQTSIARHLLPVVRTLSFNRISSVPLEDILKLCVNLSELTLAFSSPGLLADDSPTDLFPLTTLNLESRGHDIHALIQRLAPNVENLGLSSPPMVTVMTLERFSHTLKHLKMHADGMPEELSCLRIENLPLLETFSMDFCPTSSGIPLTFIPEFSIAVHRFISLFTGLAFHPSPLQSVQVSVGMVHEFRNSRKPYISTTKLSQRPDFFLWKELLDVLRNPRILTHYPTLRIKTIERKSARVYTIPPQSSRLPVS
ncbi:hypothetical protein DL96DRAFT_156125 [Flagelloscypha sp. PMI_526]|nr:hypothetical protein DL96DRAFT_156125 [Flagelloscypha sp. PMI_526]